MATSTTTNGTHTRSPAGITSTSITWSQFQDQVTEEDLQIQVTGSVANGYVLRKNDAGNGEAVTASTSGTSAIRPFGYFYPCGTKLAAGELYDVKSKVGMVTMGKNGDPSFMDIEILPGKLTVNVSIDGKPADPKADYQLKVEQTSDITVSVDPAPKPGEKYIVKYNDLYQSGIPATAAYNRLC